MANEADHVSLANKNHDFLIHLLGDSRFPDWTVTVAFYKAVHVVEAVFAADRQVHSSSHADREQNLKTARYKSIFRDYTHLFAASRIARYLECSGTGRYHQFSDYMDWDAVRKLVRKRLHGVEQHSIGFLDNNGAALEKIEPAKL